MLIDNSTYNTLGEVIRERFFAFDEELVKAAAERAALRELIEDERAYCQMTDIAIAALKVDTEEGPSEEDNK